MTYPQQLAASQANPEVIINRNAAALAALAFGSKNEATSSGLTWGYWGGQWGGTAVADGTLTLTASATNYIVADRSTGALSTSTSMTNWSNVAAYVRLYKVTTGASAVSGTPEDHRAGPSGLMGNPFPPAAASVASAAALTIPAGQRVVTITGTTGITSITATGHSGAVITLVFAAALTVTDGSNLKLASSFTATADDTLTLACDGTNWYEVARSVN